MMERSPSSAISASAAAGRASLTLEGAMRDTIAQFSMGEQRPEYLSRPLIHEAFSAAAATHPQRQCLCYEWTWLSYKEVAERVHKATLGLQALGIGPGVVVGLMLERSFELVIIMMAVFAAGGCYLPCDPSYPDDRLQIYLEDGNAALVVVQGKHKKKASSLVSKDTQIIDVSKLQQSSTRKGTAQNNRPAPAVVGPDDPAYIIFTSGSTGRPKGVLVPHRGLRDLLPCIVDDMSLDYTDVLLFCTTINFDASIIQMLPPLSIGAALIIAKPDGHMNPAYIVQLILKHQISGILGLVPTLSHVYIEELKRSGGDVLFPCMKCWGIGGESAPAHVVRAMQQVCPNLQGVRNQYGPTEATVVTIQHIFSPGFDSIVIGRPDANVHAYVVDSELRPVAVGVPGELLLSGPRLALGYAGRPDLTTEKFVPNPCLELVSELINTPLKPYYALAYRTGDLVKWRPDGTLDFLGRIDRQVKITGVRIELGEVEAALESTPGVTQAVAAAVLDPTEQKRLVGYVTPRVNPEIVLAHCRSLLVPAMVPSVVVPLQTFPLLSNGKVDVNSLPVPDWGYSSSQEYVPPADEVEVAVQAAFAEALGRKPENVSIIADFFGLGGSSLQVFHATAAIQRLLKCGLVQGTLLHTERTARGVAAALAGGGSQSAEGAPITPREWPSAARPLSFNQEQMWMLSKVAAASAYNLPSAFELNRVPDNTALQAALDAVATRHESLRTRLVQVTGGLLTGVVEPAVSHRVPLAIINLGSKSRKDADLQVLQRVAQEAELGFNLESDCLLRAVLLECPKNKGSPAAVLALTMHHAVGDAWSMAVFRRELSEAYAAAVINQQPSWDPLPIQYCDYATWQREQIRGEAGVALRQWWKVALAGVPSLLQLPADRSRPAQPTFAAKSLRRKLPVGLIKTLQAVAQNLRLNVQAVLLSVLQAVLVRYSGQDDVVVGVPVAGRDRAETHGLIGYIINTLPVRCSPPEGATFADLAHATSGAMIAAMQHSLLPLDQIIAAAGVQRIQGANPLFQVLFQYLPAEEANFEVALGDIDMAPYRSTADVSHAKLDLFVTLDGHTLLMEYMTEIYDESTIQRLLNSYLALLETAANDPQQLAAGTGLLAQVDAAAVARLSCGEVRPAFASAPMVHDAFEKIARVSPIRRCLGYEGQWLTYGEVETRASALATRLAALQVGPGVVVALMLDRSFDLMIGILAIMKAGGAYLPCDPSYPDDRLQIYLEDGNAKVTLVATRHIQRARGIVPPLAKVLDISAIAEEDEESETTTSKRNSKTTVLRRPSPEDPAYVIFTSGSTGRPKGVVVPHRGLRDHIMGSTEFYKMTPDDASLLSITITFDPHIMQAFMPLVIGARLVIVRPEGHLDPDYLMNLLASQGVTHMVSTPSLALMQLKGARVKDCTKLRAVMLCGEPLPMEPINLVADLLPSARVYNMYGPTEATVIATETICPPSVTAITIGRPVQNMHAYVVDSALRPVPVGVPGELLLSGPRLALGYAGRPDLTEEKFVPNPCLDLVAKSLRREMTSYYQKAYRTGDLVRWRPDGEIDYLGRIDRQVKITGVRIELGEVESALETAPGVTAAVASAVSGPDGLKRLVGYVSPASADPAIITAHCRAQLIPAMVPSLIIALPSFPLLPSGKVDVKSLPVPDWGSAPVAEFVAPCTELEQQLAGIWADILGLEAVGIHDDFWSIGGSSLLGGIMLSKVRSELGYLFLPSTAIFSAPTIHLLAREIELLGANDLSNSKEDTIEEEREATNDCKTRFPTYSSTAPAALIVQILGIFCLVALRLFSFLPVIVSALILGFNYGVGIAMAASGVIAVVCLAIAALVAIALKWIIMFGRYKPGVYPVWGSYHLRWWFTRKLLCVIDLPLRLVQGTLLHTVWLRLLGARICAGVVINTCNIGEADLIEIGAGAILEMDAVLEPATYKPGHKLVIAPLSIGAGARLGQRCLVQGGCNVAPGTVVEPMTALTTETHKQRSSKGAKHDEDTEELGPETPRVRYLKCVAALFVILLHGYACLPATAAIYPLAVATGAFTIDGFSLYDGKSADILLYILLVLLVGQIVIPASYYLLVVLVKHLVLGRPRMLPDGQPDLSTTWLQIRHWTLGRLIDSPVMRFGSNSAGFSEVGSMLMRCLGARIGRRVFCEFPHCYEPDLLVVGDDGEVGGDVQCEWGMTLEPFAAVTHGCVLEPGCTIGSGGILGDYSVLRAHTYIPSTEIWIGAPRAAMLRRNAGADLILEATKTPESSSDIPSSSSYFNSTKRRKKKRKMKKGEEASSSSSQLDAMEQGTNTTYPAESSKWQEEDVAAMRAVLHRMARLYPISQAIIIILTPILNYIKIIPYGVFLWLVRSAYQSQGGAGSLEYFVLWPAIGMVGMFIETVIYIAYKWIIVGRLGEGNYRFHGKHHTAWSLLANLTVQSEGTLNAWQGSAYYIWLWRAVGASIGKDALIECPLQLEPDLITVGERAMLSPLALVQGHTIENHTVQHQAISLGDYAYSGTGASILPGGQLQARAQLAPLSLVFKGEVVSSGTLWSGVPAAPVRRVGAPAAASESAKSQQHMQRVLTKSRVMSQGTSCDALMSQRLATTRTFNRAATFAARRTSSLDLDTVEEAISQVNSRQLSGRRRRFDLDLGGASSSSSSAFLQKSASCYY